MESQKVKITI